MPTDLKPCPNPKCESSSPRVFNLSANIGIEEWMVECETCGTVLRLVVNSRDGAIQLWNERFYRPPTDEQMLAIADRIADYLGRRMGIRITMSDEDEHRRARLACFEEPDE